MGKTEIKQIFAEMGYIKCYGDNTMFLPDVTLTYPPFGNQIS